MLFGATEGVALLRQCPILAGAVQGYRGDRAKSDSEDVPAAMRTASNIIAISWHGLTRPVVPQGLSF